MQQNQVMLVAFYNKKALGVRYLETALKDGGYQVRSVFYKDFNSVRPTKTTERELALLKTDIAEKKPLFIGLSVMSSMYLETVDQMIAMIRASFDIPIVCGGAFATMFPSYFLERGVDYVIRSDGEIAMRRLADALRDGADPRGIPSLCFLAEGEVVMNDVADLQNDIDAYGLPSIHCMNACFIENDTLTEGDPQLDTLSYEVIASRGCPFTCSYCCCCNLHRLMPPGIRSVRTRSVQSVIDELIEAKKQCKKIVFVHFYDEIFPNLPGWVDAFAAAYKEHIDLPFTIWSHPKAVNREVLQKLVKVGLTEVIMGIQSGSERVRRDVFHRYETQEDIIRATQIIRESGVFWGSFDLMLQHPFETIDDLKESYYLAKQLCRPYELQLHGLNFLPGTDIVSMAIEQGYYTQEEMDRIMFAPMDEQFGAYWHRETSRESDLWFKMIYCVQFRHLAKKMERFETDPLMFGDAIDAAYQKAKRMTKLRYFYKKARIVLKRLLW